MSAAIGREVWTSRIGVILAVAGSAVGLGNFLRFPGLAAKYGVIIPVSIYMYYVYIEAWCAGYAWYFLTGKLNLGGDVQAYKDFWINFVGANTDGLVVGPGHNQVVIFLALVFGLNFVIIYRGLARGIEAFCKYAMPALVLLALIILGRVLTLGTPDPAQPDQNVLNGLGFMWNPGDVARQLRKPELWLAAAGQIFFSLSVGFGVIVTYASYLTEKDDVVLSGLAASSANEFCEVSLGGLITVPAAFVFLGAAGVTTGFALGFHVLPLVFSKMPFPAFFGTVWFFLLFLAAVTSSLSMLQPGIAFLEEGLGLNRKQSCALLGLITALGCLFVVYFSKDVKALDTIDFWVGTLLIFVMGGVLLVTFGWIVGIEKGWAEAHKGAEIRIPNFFKPLIKYVSPLYLLGIFALWVLFDVFGLNLDTGRFDPKSYVLDLVGSESQPPSTVARLSVGVIAIFVVFVLVLIASAGRRWNRNDGRGAVKRGA
jgi:NSS family neurotransmitter:Na+ symporter